ncbi:hypothetical protein [Pseudochrobactrum kiredjianiae]|uniref:Uncharacterized protein n=1 Tax=Pseudochrobactrum kiredjianiae TaxID=386305 RepID=A0ABW3V235_9HYPH|nr:hypothetical protein [Pseudochrobactrum kiredjianiae]MDM7851069.1 hypothetical protein [Pseudochrobactrum kiredjianiae]
MGSAATLFLFALLFGTSKALSKLIAGAESSEVLTSFAGSAVIGTLITWAVVWGVLRLFEKQQSAITITNWILALGIFVSLSLTIGRMS